MHMGVRLHSSGEDSDKPWAVNKQLETAWRPESLREAHIWVSESRRNAELETQNLILSRELQ